MAYPPGPYYTGDWTDQHESAREEVGNRNASESKKEKRDSFYLESKPLV